MITIFKTGEFDYSDIGIDKPVRYTMQNLVDIASRTSKVNITRGHSKEVIGEMSNFIVKDGLLMAEEPNNLESKGMGYSPVYNYDLVDMGDFYEPTNIVMTEIGYTKNPRTKIIYNSITVPNGEEPMNQEEINKMIKRNNELQEEIGVLKNTNQKLSSQIQEKNKEIKEIKESNSANAAKLKEYDSLKEIESSYNKILNSQRQDLIYQIVGDDKAKAEKFKDYTIEQLENTVDLLKAKKGGKGITPQNHKIDDGNDPDNDDDEDEDVYTDEQFEEDFKNSGL